MLTNLVTSFFKDVIYLFLEKGEVREKERERNIDVWLPLACPQLGTQSRNQASALTGNRTSNPLVHRLVLNLLSHTSQGLYNLIVVMILHYICVSKSSHCTLRLAQCCTSVRSQ